MHVFHSLGLLALMGLASAACGSDEQRPRGEGKDGSVSEATEDTEGDDGALDAGTSPSARTDASRSDPSNVGRDGGGRTDATRSNGCPAAEPALGSACTPLGDDCNFGQKTCECARGSNTWVCWSPSDCPTTLPADTSACSLVGIVCEFDPPADAGAGQEEVDCECTATGWDCGELTCPAAAPTSGAQCDSGEGTCTYGEQTCECDSRLWTCWKQSDCPTAQPTEASACSLDNISCLYGANECECESGSWGCGPVEEGAEEEEEEEEEGEEEGEEEEGEEADAG